MTFSQTIAGLLIMSALGCSSGLPLGSLQPAPCDLQVNGTDVLDVTNVFDTSTMTTRVKLIITRAGQTPVEVSATRVCAGSSAPALPAVINLLVNDGSPTCVEMTFVAQDNVIINGGGIGCNIEACPDVGVKLNLSNTLSTVVALDGTQPDSKLCGHP